MKNSGIFITLDGGDGVGKSSQAARLRDLLESSGKPVLLCHDPGTTRLGESVRAILLRSEGVEIGAMGEMFLFMAARAQMMEEIILPALEAGKVVIADRFLLSTLVYQGYAGGLSPKEIMDVGRIAVCGRFPDLTVLLDLPPETGMARINRPLDRMERKGAEFHRKVREGFLKGIELMKREYGAATAVIDASPDPETVAAQIKEAVLGVPGIIGIG